MTVRVELFGIPRQRAGKPLLNVEGRTLGEVLESIGALLPLFAEHCLDGRNLRSGFLANINGEQFTTNPDTPVQPGDSVLILSADVGG